MADMQLDKGIPVKFGNMTAMVYGGPFRKFVSGTRRLVGVKMAAEITHPNDISIPTKDFSIPDTGAMQAGLEKAVQSMFDGKDIYAGCMGGVGRTGLFMGCMAKLMKDTNNLGADVDPVEFVRDNYISHAIETQEQMNFVRGFDTVPLLKMVDDLVNPRTVTRVITEVKEVEVFPSCWDRFKRWISGALDKTS